MIVQSGSINSTALVVPDLYIQIVPPSVTYLNGVATNVVGMVGTASWGPVGKPSIVSSMADYASTFGPIMNRTYDMGTHVATAVQQGASNFRCVRVTDGTDTAATGTLGTTWLTFTSLYTGTLGNNITVTWSTGSAAGSYRLVVSIISGGSQSVEVFDNLTGTGNALAVAAAAAINSGNGVLRGASQIVTAAAGAGTTIPTTGTSVTLSGGTDGVATITSSVLVGVDTVPRKGMYALRGQGCSVGDLCDASDSTQWLTQESFGLSEGIYMILTGPSGDTISNAVTVKATAGIDSYAAKLMFGDWIYWYDPTNAVTRLVSPQGFVAGRIGNLSPEQSSLNKALYSVVGSQKSGTSASPTNTTYSQADLQTLFQAGIDVIANPGAGGLDIWTVRCGHNSSSNSAVNGDNYTRMTNYIAATLNAGMGIYIGKVVNTDLFDNIRATLLAFFQAMLNAGMLSDNYGVPFSVACDTSNNPQSRTSLGYVQADCKVRYMGINEKFIVNLEGGTTVTVTSSTSAA
ncbi:MAG: phage tail protein [Acetobacteraceae bacterium]|nr:phage tail protein [Acetobacteraceae bacterium]